MGSRWRQIGARLGLRASPVQSTDDTDDGPLAPLAPGAAAGRAPRLTHYSSADLDANPDLANTSCWNWSGAGNPEGKGTSDDWFIESHNYMDEQNKCITLHEQNEPMLDPIDWEPFTSTRKPCRVGRSPDTSSCYDAKSLAQWFRTRSNSLLPLSRNPRDNHAGTGQMPRLPTSNLPVYVSAEQIISCCNPTRPGPVWRKGPARLLPGCPRG